MPGDQRPLFVVTNRLLGRAPELLAKAGELRYFERDEPLGRAELLAGVEGATALLAMLADRIDGELLDAAGPGLRVVANVAVGFDNVDLEAAATRGVAVANTPGVLVDATADLTLGLLLAAARRVAEGDRLVRRGEGWRWSMEFMLGSDLRGATLGIVGLGQIGRAVARRARAFGMEVVYSGRRPAPAAVEAELGARRLELDQLLSSADVVSLHAPLTPETRGLIGAAELARMKPTAILVNTARGAQVDEAALAAALRDGVIGAAGLDVYAEEPRVDPDLLELDNVVLTPHIGSAADRTRAAMSELAARNAIAGARGEELETPVPLPTDPSR